MFQVQATGRQRFAYDGKKLGTFATFLGKIGENFRDIFLNYWECYLQVFHLHSAQWDTIFNINISIVNMC